MDVLSTQDQYCMYARMDVKYKTETTFSRKKEKKNLY